MNRRWVTKNIVGILAYDLAEEGKKLGPGSNERCQKGIDLYLEILGRKEKIEFVAAAGMADSKKFPKQRFTMAMMILAVLEYRGVNERHIENLNVHDTPKIWGTEAEIRAFEKYANTCGDSCVLHIVSHWWHLPRLWYITKKLGVNAHLHGARGSNKGILYEFYKLPGQIILDVLR